MDKNKSTATANSGSVSAVLLSATTKKSKNSSPMTSSTSVATATTSSNETTKNTKRDNVLPQPMRRVLQNFLLVWLDANLDESQEDFKKSLQQLRHIVASITTFADAHECVDFLSEIKNEKIFMIVSGALGQHIIPEIQNWPQLDSVYVFCGNPPFHEKWTKKISKIKGVYTKIEQICEALQIAREHCDRAMVSISFNGIDPLFMYTQFLKEALLDIEDDDTKSIKELIQYCRLQEDIDGSEIDKVEREYLCHTPIWWYTAPYFMYSMLNRGLRLMDVDIILKMGFFIRHLHQHIEKLHREQQCRSTTPFRVFRGQGLSLENFEKMKKTNGGLMSFNNFLSTSCNRNVSLNNFARPAAHDPDSVGILFVMTIDPQLCLQSSTPFADVKAVGYFEGGEEEILFSAHTIFRIDKIQRIHDDHADRLWEVNLTLIGNDDHELNTLVSHLRNELNQTTGWSRLGNILIKLGEHSKVEHLYKILLEKTSCEVYRSEYNLNLGNVYHSLGEYSKALLHYEKNLEFKKKILPPNHPILASAHEGMGLAYHTMGDYSKAFSSYERSLEIRKIAFSPNHLDLAASYNNIGVLHNTMGEYSKALSSYERSLEIRKIALPTNHPELATSYSNIGDVYNSMGVYSEALSSFERALEIREIALPSNHPDLATLYNNFGKVYYNMGEYSKALTYYEKGLEIIKKTFPSTYPDLGPSYHNIGLVHFNMGEYSKALTYYQQAKEILEKSLPPTHPYIPFVNRSIEKVQRKL